MQSFDLAQPTALADAIRLAAVPDAKFIGGGTDLLQLMKDRVERPRHLVDINALPMAAIEATPIGVRIGALARMADVAEHPTIVRDYPAVSQALLASASGQVRNMAAIGGNLLQRTRCGYFRDTGFPCNKRVPGSGCPAIEGENRFHAVLGGSDHCVATHASDLAVALAALDATVEVTGPNGRRDVKLVDFHLLPGDTPEHETVLTPGELITAVTLEASALTRGSHYLKVRDRASFEWALISAAVALEVAGGQVRGARVAMGGIGTKPWRLPAVEAALVGGPPTESAFRTAAGLAIEGAHPLSGNGFKLTLLQNTLVRALRTAAA
jgi:xanthine dehydrogenase YagS FAD-binding subunit